MNGYSMVSAVALICYVFLLVTFLATRKEQRVYYSFIVLLVALILWSSGSVAMRLELWPSVSFWNYVSVFGILMLPVMYYHFVLDFLEDKRSNGRYFWLIAFAVLAIVNQCTDWFIPAPDVQTVNGTTQFIYRYDWPIYLVFVVVALCLGQLALLIRRHCKGNRAVFTQLIPVITGMAVLFGGHIVATLPIFLGIPVDIISGVVNAGLLMYALYRQRLFRMTMLLSRSNCYVLAVVIGVAVCSNFLLPLQNFLINTVTLGRIQSIVVVAMLLMAAIALLYVGISIFFDRMFVRRDQKREELLANFSQNVTRLLDGRDILQELSDAIQNAMDVYRIFALIRSESGEYRVAHTASPLEEKNFFLPADYPLVAYFKVNPKCLLQREFVRTTAYLGIWEREKQTFERMNIQCYCPLVCDGELIGIILLDQKKDTSSYNESDIKYLQSLMTACAVAVKNAQTYESALNEARRDELTGLVSRKYFYELLDREFDRCKDSSLALSLLNIDDFKLYNQLYGTAEGDQALVQVAGILMASISEGCHACRINGKEFALILPGFDIYSAKMLTENIVEQIGNINNSNGRIYSRITVSAGICAAPYMASTPRELLRNADAAVYSVKRSGKNAVRMYSEEACGAQAQQNSHISGYSEHASTIYALTAAIDTKDHYTFRHSQNVSYYASELAKAMGLDERLVEIVREAGLLHDIGKIGIREDILRKTGPLTREEHQIMRSHVDNAVNIIRYLPSLDYVIPAVLSHHERYDGAGYPRKLAGEEIPVTGRILCIADAFDAMTSVRSYREPFTSAKALEILKQEAGKQFDPGMVPIFVQLIENGRVEPRPQLAVTGQDTLIRIG